MASDFEAFKKRFKAGKVKMLANPAPLPGPGGIARAAIGKAVQMGGSSWRQKITEASNRPYKGRGSGVPAKVTKPRGNINRAYAQESIKMSAPGRSSGTSMTTAPSSRAMSTRSSTALQKVSNSPASRVVGVSGRTAATTAAKANIPGVARNKNSGMSYTGTGKLGKDVPRRQAASTYTSPYDKKAGPILPSVSMAGGGVNKPASKATGTAKDKIKAGQQGQAKKKTGTTTSAAPAKPKRKSHFQRRQAERYAIGTSGKSL